MTYIFDPNRSIYIQVMEDIKKKIVSGEYQSGDKIQPVRELANIYQINPNTMQKALSELERENILFSKSTSGRFISKDEEIIHNLKKEFVNEKLDTFINELHGLGYNNNDIIELLKNKLNNK